MNKRRLIFLTSRRYIVSLCSLFLFLAVWAPSVALAQAGASSAGTVEVDGYVLDRDRKPIEFANVKVAHQAVGTYSNLKGYYKLSLPVANDSVVLEFSSIGYRSVSRVVAVRKPGKIRCNVELPEADIEIGTVTVVGKASKGQNMEQIKAEHIKANVGPVKGVESVVGTYAGVTQSNELSSQYSVRGGNYDENLVYVNGLEVRRPLLVRTAQQEGLSFVNPDLVQSVYFSAGAFGAEYGERNASVLDITYKTPQNLIEGSLRAAIQDQSLYLGNKKGSFSQITGIRLKRGKALLRSLETKAEYDPLYADGQTYLQWKPNARFSLGLLGNLSYTHYVYKPTKRETAFGSMSNAKKFTVYFDGAEKDRFLNYTVAGNLSFIPNDLWHHTLLLSYFQSAESETYDISGSYYLSQEGGVPGDEEQEGVPGRSDALATGTNHDHARNKLFYSVSSAAYKGSYQRSTLGTIRWGMGVQWEQVQDLIAEWTLLDSAGYNIPRCEDAIVMQYNLYAQEHLSSVRTAAYAQYKNNWHIEGGNIELQIGGRLSWWSYNKEWIPSVRLQTAFTPQKAERLRFRLAGGLYSQAPFYKELRVVKEDHLGNNYVWVNSAVKAQGSLQVLLGMDYRFAVEDRPFKATVEGYFKYLYRINPYYINNVKIRYLGDNLGTGTIAGVDFKLFGEFVPEVESWLTLSLMKAVQRIQGYGTMPMPNAPLYNFSLFFQDYFPGYRKIRLSMRAALSGGVPQLDPTQGFSKPVFTSPPYKRVDLGMHYRVLDQEDPKQAHWTLSKGIRSLDLELSVFNLFDMSNVSSYFWIADAYRNRYAVPNYLTGRVIDLGITMTF